MDETLEALKVAAVIDGDGEARAMVAKGHVACGVFRDLKLPFGFVGPWDRIGQTLHDPLTQIVDLKVKSTLIARKNCLAERGFTGGRRA